MRGTSNRSVASVINADPDTNISMSEKTENYVIRPANLPLATRLTTAIASVNIALGTSLTDHLIQHHQVVKETYATLDQLEEHASVIDLEDIDHHHDLVPLEDQPGEQPVNTKAELVDLVNKLRQQIQFLQGTSDQLEVNRVIQSLSEEPLDTAFNNAQRLYTTVMLKEVDLPFATLLATSLDAFFRAQGRVNPTWADFISRTMTVTD